MEYDWPKVMCYDFETTGANIYADRPVQIGVCDGNGRIMMNTYVNPYMPIPAEATQVHGISDDLVREAPDYVAALWGLGRLLFVQNEEIILAGFNTTRFDTPIFEKCCNTEVANRVTQLDLLDVIYRYWPTLENKKLVGVYEHFTGKPLVGAHGAIQDCIGTAAVLKKVCEHLQKTPDELAEELKTPKVYEIMPIGKHKGKRISEVPHSWAQWMRNNAKDMRADLEKTVNYILGAR